LWRTLRSAARRSADREKEITRSPRMARIGTTSGSSSRDVRRLARTAPREPGHLGQRPTARLPVRRSSASMRRRIWGERGQHVQPGAAPSRVSWSRTRTSLVGRWSKCRSSARGFEAGAPGIDSDGLGEAIPAGERDGVIEWCGKRERLVHGSEKLSGRRWGEACARRGPLGGGGSNTA